MDKSAPFQAGAKFEPLSTPLQGSIRFYPVPLPSLVHSFPLWGSIPPAEGTHRAYHVPHNKSNSVCFVGAIYEPGGTMSICRGYKTIPSAASVPLV